MHVNDQTTILSLRFITLPIDQDVSSRSFLLSVLGTDRRLYPVSCQVVSVYCIVYRNLVLGRGDINENVDQNQKEVFEEMGVQTDEDVEVSHEAFSKLQTKRQRR